MALQIGHTAAQVDVAVHPVVQFDDFPESGLAETPPPQ